VGAPKVFQRPSRGRSRRTGGDTELAGLQIAARQQDRFDDVGAGAGRHCRFDEHQVAGIEAAGDVPEHRPQFREIGCVVGPDARLRDDDVNARGVCDRRDVGSR
jgi:hypothetical protein